MSRVEIVRNRNRVAIVVHVCRTTSTSVCVFASMLHSGWRWVDDTGKRLFGTYRYESDGCRSVGLVAVRASVGVIFVDLRGPRRRSRRRSLTSNQEVQHVAG